MMAEPPLRVWMQEAVPPATCYETRPGRWVAEEHWPSPRIEEEIWHLNANGLARRPARATTLTHSSEVTAGLTHGDWCPYGYDAEMPSDQREEDGRSLSFTSPPLEPPSGNLGRADCRYQPLGRQAAGPALYSPLLGRTGRRLHPRHLWPLQPGPPGRP